MTTSRYQGPLAITSVVSSQARHPSRETRHPSEEDLVQDRWGHSANTRPALEAAPSLVPTQKDGEAGGDTAAGGPGTGPGTEKGQQAKP